MNKRKSQIFKILPPKEKFISFIKMYTNKTHTNYEFTYEKYNKIQGLPFAVSELKDKVSEYLDK